MNKLLLLICAVLLAMPAIADDGAAVVARTNCDDLRAQIATLNTGDDLSDADAALLYELRLTYRRDCARRASSTRSNRTVAKTRAQVKMSDDTKSDENADNTVTAPACDAPDVNGCCPNETLSDIDGVAYCCQNDGDVCFIPMAVKKTDAVETPAPTTPVRTDAEIAAEINANIAAGLCADGTKPNKYGCCADELFRDMGGTFACCPKSGGDCFPPITGAAAATE